jgi:hypothetical protein
VRLALDTRTPLVLRLPELDLECLRAMGRKHAIDRQLFLVELLGMSYERRRPHRTERQADSFDRDFLVKGLRVSPRADVYTRLLEPFYDFPKGNYGYSKDSGTTKAYRLRSTAWSALQAVYRSDEPVPVILSDDPGKELGIDQLEHNGLPQTVAKGFIAPSVLSITAQQVDHAITRVEEWLGTFGDTMCLDPAKPDSTTLGEAYRLLHATRKWVVSLGGVPNLYHEQSHGRLGPNGFHVITMPSRLRHLLFEGSGMVDYDIASCFWSIFLSLGQALSFPTSNVNDYVSSKAEWHQLWALTTGHRYPDDFKAVTTSWLTGGTLSSSPKTQSGRNLGTRGMQTLAANPAARAVYNEVQHGMKRIVRKVLKVESDGGEQVYVNAVGKRLALKQRPGDFGRLCCHALTGFEQFAIREMCGQAAGLQAIIYDGFIASPQPVSRLEELVRKRSTEEFGVTLDLRLRTTSLSEPVPDLRGDAGDF